MLMGISPPPHTQKHTHTITHCFTITDGGRFLVTFLTLAIVIALN